MPAVLRINERNGVVPGTVTHGITNLNFGNIDAAHLSYTAHPIRRGQNSFDKWIKLEWYTGAANRLSNFKFWRSDSLGGSGPSLPTGISIVCEVGVLSDLTYVQPSITSIGNHECPNTEAGGMVVGPSQLTAVGSTYFVRVQMKTTSQAATGDVPVQYFSFSWDEE